MFNKDTFLTDLRSYLKEEYGAEPKTATAQQIHDAVSRTVMQSISADWEKSRKAHLAARRACYFSMEFLVGRAVYNNLLCLGIEVDVRAGVAGGAVQLSEREESEDAALGNGG